MAPGLPLSVALEHLFWIPRSVDGEWGSCLLTSFPSTTMWIDHSSDSLTSALGVMGVGEVWAVNLNFDRTDSSPTPCTIGSYKIMHALAGRSSVST